MGRQAGRDKQREGHTYRQTGREDRDALCLSRVAVSLLSSVASRDIKKLNKVEESMNN